MLYERERGIKWNKVRFLQTVIYIVSTLGILMGIDLLCGAKITSNLNKTLNKTVLDLDNVIAKLLSHFRKTVDTSISIDEKIIKTKSRIILGLLFIAICTALLFIAKKG